MANFCRSLRSRGHRVCLYAHPVQTLQLADRTDHLRAASPIDRCCGSRPSSARTRLLARPPCPFRGDGSPEQAQRRLRVQPQPASIAAALGKQLHSLRCSRRCTRRRFRGLSSVPPATPTARFVAVSEFVARQWYGLPRPAITGYNGIDVDAFLAGDGGEDLVWVGRITPEKGTDLAIEFARRSGRRFTGSSVR